MRLHLSTNPRNNAPDATADRPRLAVFDSGIGGLSVIRALLRQAPELPLLYLADQAHAPYGERSSEEVAEKSIAIVEEFIRHGTPVVAIACNTASAAALYDLRQRFPTRFFIGMEPAVKPAAENSKTGKIGVLATALTLTGRPYAGVVARFAQHLQVHTLACPEFVHLVEAGDTDSPQARRVIEDKLRPLIELGIDQLVLGCTHYSFLKKTIQDICPPTITVIDPSEAVARQARRVWQSVVPATDSLFGNRIPARFATTAPQPCQSLEKAVHQYVDSKAIVEIAEWRP